MRNDLRLRAATFAPDTYDAETNTIEVVLSTGAAVQRAGYVEKLPVANADLRGVEGSPVLDAHRQDGVQRVLGVIQKAWKAGGEIRALLKLSSRDDVAGVIRDVADGIIRNLSVGYRVKQWADSTSFKGERVRTALAWSIHEASFVPIGADAGAKTRSIPMKKKAKAGANPAPVDELENEETANENTAAQTRDAIRAVFKRALPRDLERAYAEADEIMDAGGDVADANARALEIMQESGNAAPRARVINPGPSPEQAMQRRQDALYARVTGTKPKDEAREFYNVRLVDHARAFLAARNESTVGMSELDVITRAHSVSDFPLLLEGTGNRVLMEQFEAAQTPLLRLGRTATAPDFRDLQRLRISEMGALQPLSENGELQNVSRSEIADAYAIGSAGAIFSLSFRAQVNDDLSAFSDWGRAMAQQAAQYQKNTIVDLIQGNPNTEDNQPLFSAAHGNVASDPGNVSVAALSAARVAIRTQKGLDGVTALNLRPQFLVVGAELETAAEQVLAEIAAATVDTVNPFSGSLELLVESALTPGDWYVFASPNAAPVFEHAWLQGYTGPQLASQENFRTLARDFRVVIHWGAGLLPGGWRGAYFNQGSEDSNTAFI